MHSRDSIEKRIAAAMARLAALKENSPRDASLALQAVGIAQALLLQALAAFESLELQAKLVGKSMSEVRMTPETARVGMEAAHQQLTFAEQLLSQLG